MGARLAATRDALVRGRTGAPTEMGVGYATSQELRNDLVLIERSLAENRGEHAGLDDVRAVARQVEVFGFHLAKLDVRIPASWARDSVREAWGLPAVTEDVPIAIDDLHRALAEPRVPPPPKSPGMRAMEALAAMPPPRLVRRAPSRSS